MTPAVVDTPHPNRLSLLMNRLDDDVNVVAYSSAPSGIPPTSIIADDGTTTASNTVDTPPSHTLSSNLPSTCFHLPPYHVTVYGSEHIDLHVLQKWMTTVLNNNLDMYAENDGSVNLGSDQY